MSEPGTQAQPRATLEEQQPWLTWALAAALSASFLLMTARGVSPREATGDELVAWGGAWGPKLIDEHQLWRFITAPLLHVAWWHAALSVLALLLVGPQLERLVGRARFSVIFASSVFAATLAGVAAEPLLVFCGSTGGVAGLYAQSAIVVWLEPERVGAWSARQRRAPFIFFALLVPLFFMRDMGGPQLLAGVLAGGLCGLVFDAMRRRPPARAALAAALVCALVAAGVGGLEYLAAKPELAVFQLTAEARRAGAAGDSKRALALSEQAIALQPASPDVLYVHGEALLMTGDFAGAEEVANRSAAMNPGNAAALVLRCEARAQQRRDDDALPDCVEAAGLSKDPRQRSYALSRAAEIRGRRAELSEALRLADEAVHLAPHAMFARITRGKVYLSRHELDPAELDFKLVTVAEPANPAGWLGLCEVSAGREQLEAAAGFCDRSIALAPGSREVALEGADIFARRGDFVDAVRQLDETIAATPDDAELLNSKAWYERAQGKPELALRDITRAAALNAEHPGILGTRCWVLLDLGRRDEALADCKRAAAKSPAPGVDDAMVRYIEGDRAGAAAEWREYLRREPGDALEIRDYLERASAPAP